MRWLYSQGMLPWQIAEMTDGNIDSEKKIIYFYPPWKGYRGWGYDFKGKREEWFERNTDDCVSYQGTPWEEYLSKGLRYSKYVFVWRKPNFLKDHGCVYSVEQIEEIVGLDSYEESLEKLLTKKLEFDTIETTK